MSSRIPLPLFVFLIALVMASSPSQAALVYQWQFDDDGLLPTPPATPGPITGTITFNSAVLGTPYSGLPDSITIASAPAYTFNTSGYVVGTEVIGSLLAQTTQAIQTWEIDAAGNITAGYARFLTYDPTFTFYDTLELNAKTTPAPVPSRLESVDIADYSFRETLGIATFSPVPESSSIALLGFAVVGVTVVRRRRVQELD